MDRDHSNTIDRIEWISYLCAPIVNIYQLGNMDYYDFEMRELFDEIDKDKDGLVVLDELVAYLKKDFGGDYKILDE